MTCKTDLCDTSYRLWYKADELSLNEGENVSSWTDFSGFGENLTQSVEANQPQLRTRQLVSLPSLRFAAANDQLNVNTDVFNNKSHFICCFPVRLGDTSGQREFVWYGIFTGDWAVGFGTNGSTLNVFIPPTLPNAGTVFCNSAGFISNTTDFFRVGVIYDGDSPTNETRLRVFKDGVQQALTFVGTIPPRMQLITDTTLRVGDIAGVPSTGTIEIPEIIIQTDKVNVNELLEIDAYLEDKYFL